MYGGGADGFGGASQFAGGGFMPPSDTSNTPFSPGSKKAGNSSTGLTPITFRQISRANFVDDNFEIDGQPVSNITAVARILSKEIRTTDARFTVDDGTGIITVKNWIDSDSMEEREALADLKPNTYVRIHGHFRSLNGRTELQAYSIKPILDFNEITYHQLECIFVHLSNTKAQGGATLTSAQQPSQYNSQYGAQQTSGGGSIGDLQAKIQAMYESEKVISMEAGLSYHEAAMLIPGYTKTQIKEAIDFLVNEGHLYSTIDDDHFKSTMG